MAREIKFRAWNRRDSLMMDAVSIQKIMSINFKEYELGDYEFMQYTGLKDKNGIEVYEGDILKARHYEYEEDWVKAVTFENGTFTIGRYWKDGIHTWCSMEQFCPSELEVIGNIYEHPHLLEQGNA